MTQAVTNSPPGQAEPEATKSVSKTRRAVEVYSEAQERLNDALDKLQHHASDRLGRAVDYVAAQLEGQLLRLNADDQITGLPAEFMQRCFAEFCQRGHGRELSRRQRSAYVEPFNLICEQVQPYLMVTLTPVKNYLRGPRPLPVQPRFIVHVRPSTYDKLMIALLADVFSREAATPETWFLRVALLMVLRIGVTFTGCLQALCWVRRCDLYPDYLSLPRDPKRRRWLRVWLDEVTAIAWHALVMARARLPADGKRRKRTVQPLADNTILATGVVTLPSQKELRPVRRKLQDYLNRLCQRAGVPQVTLTEVTHLTRFVMTARGVYPSDVIAVLSGHMISSVLPLSRTRAEAQADWRTVTRLPRWRSPLPSRAEIFESSEMTVPIKQRIQWDERLLPMQRLKITEIQGVLRDKEDVAGIRCECATAFEQMAKSWLKMASDAGLRDGILNQAEAGDNIIETNLVCVAAWMVDLLNLGKRLTTLRTYLSDIKAILATFPNQPLWELGDAEREQIAEFDLLTRSPTKRLAAWRSLRTFLQSLGLPLAALSSKNPRCERQTVAEDIFTPADVPKLMGALADIGTPQAHEAFIATPFAFYATLRIDEVLSIRICHMMLAGDAPYLDIRNAKGAKSRRVYLTHVPPELLTQLRELRNDRVTELRKRHPKLGSEALFQLPFIDPGRVDVSSLEKVFQKAAQRIGRGSCTFHDLRKGGANWRYANGTDVRLIAQGLGHGACGVTYLSYLRSTDLRQREAVLRMPHSVQLSRAKLAALLSIEDSSYVTRLAQRNSGHDRLVQNAITVQLAKRVLGISQD